MVQNIHELTSGLPQAGMVSSTALSTFRRCEANLTTTTLEYLPKLKAGIEFEIPITTAL